MNCIYSHKKSLDKNSIRIGVLLYRGDDTFIGTLRSGLEDKAKEYEQETGIKVKLDIMDAKGSQNTQNSQVERLISLGCDALCINSVDRSSASIIIDKAMDAGTPVVFFNREPVEEDMNRWEKLYYVGADGGRWIRDYNPKVVGFDFPQDYEIRKIRTAKPEDPIVQPVHDFVLKEGGILMIEYLTNLWEVGQPTCQLIALPLNTKNADGSQIRVIAVTEQP